MAGDAILAGLAIAGKVIGTSVWIASKAAAKIASGGK